MLSVTLQNRRLRLPWCQRKVTSNANDWRRIALNDESRFPLGKNGDCGRRVWKTAGELYESCLSLKSGGREWGGGERRGLRTRRERHLLRLAVVVGTAGPPAPEYLRTRRCGRHSAKVIGREGEKKTVRLLASQQGEPASIAGRVTPDFSMWESYRTTPLIGEFPWGSPPPPPALAFRRCSILASFHPFKLSRPRGSLIIHSQTRPSSGSQAMPITDESVWRFGIPHDYKTTMAARNKHTCWKSYRGVTAEYRWVRSAKSEPKIAEYPLSSVEYYRACPSRAEDYQPSSKLQQP
ncbi:hypothetical protein PR048_001474 [Dryococelus australis]|uniref:Uncharacterized protein n=1 Tax=Dryococelus australis TaxID=614101 RepID=A0ABQ9IHK9_9NEOP|nr:hypothetical protein PR048_001474 [Dryococelus australis]